MKAKEGQRTVAAPEPYTGDGRPFDHDKAARDLVVDVLLRAAHAYRSQGSMTPEFQIKASHMLDSLAMYFDLHAYEKVSADRDKRLEGFAKIVRDAL